MPKKKIQKGAGKEEKPAGPECTICGEPTQAGKAFTCGDCKDWCCYDEGAKLKPCKEHATATWICAGCLDQREHDWYESILEENQDPPKIKEEKN